MRVTLLGMPQTPHARPAWPTDTHPVPAEPTWAQGLWAQITGNGGIAITATLTAALLGGLAVYLLMRRPRRGDFSKHLMYVPLLLVNAAAIYGQVAFFYRHVAPPTWPVPGKLALALLIAAAIESIAVYVGWHAHDALLMKASATARQLRRASYAIAFAVGGINYWHFAGPGMFTLEPTAASIAFGLLSLLSPWLWGLHTRRLQHVQLTREGAMDVTGVTFSSERARLYPFRTFMARRWSIDKYVTDPQQAWEGYNAERDARRALARSSRVRGAWLVLSGQAYTQPIQLPAIRVDSTVGAAPDTIGGHLVGSAPDIDGDTRPDVVTGHGDGTTPDTGTPDAPDTVPDSPTGQAADTEPDTRPDASQDTVPDAPQGIPTGQAPDTTGAALPDTGTVTTRTPRRPARRTPDRTPKWTKEQLKAFRLRDTRPDMTYPLIAREVGVSEKTVSRWFQRREASMPGDAAGQELPPTTGLDLPIREPNLFVTAPVNGSHPHLEETRP